LPPQAISCVTGTDTQNGCLWERKITFTATACGLSTDCVVTYTWSEPGALAATCPPAMTVGCEEDVPAAATTATQFGNQSGTISGFCGTVTITHTDALTPCTSVSQATISRTYS